MKTFGAREFAPMRRYFDGHEYSLDAIGYYHKEDAQQYADKIRGRVALGRIRARVAPVGPGYVVYSWHDRSMKPREFKNAGKPKKPTMTRAYLRSDYFSKGLRSECRDEFGPGEREAWYRLRESRRITRRSKIMSKR